MILIAIFIILFTWAIARGFQSEGSQISIFRHPSNFKKPIIEVVEKRKQDIKSDKRINLLEYVEERKKEQDKQMFGDSGENLTFFE